MINKWSDKSMEVYLPALLEKYDRPTNKPTDRRTTDRPGHREVTLPIILHFKLCIL